MVSAQVVGDRGDQPIGEYGVGCQHCTQWAAVYFEYHSQSCNVTQIAWFEVRAIHSLYSE